jgi:hypothetical protein
MALLSPPCHPPQLAPARHRLASHHLLAVPETPSSLLSLPHYHHSLLLPSAANAWPPRRHRRRGVAAYVGQEEPGFTDTSITSVEEGATVPPISFDAEAGAVAVSDEPADASPEDLESIAEIKRVRGSLASSFRPVCILGMNSYLLGICCLDVVLGAGSSSEEQGHDLRRGMQFALILNFLNCVDFLPFQ